MVEIFHFDLGARGNRDIFRGMALLAFLRPMLADQRESGFFGMVEAVAINTGENETDAIVFHVAAGAIGLSQGRFIRPGMHPGMRFDALANLAMTLETIEAF